jgi:hypothetical protein
MNLGQGMHFGIFKYAITVVVIYLFTDLMVELAYCSLKSHRVPIHYVSFSMQTRRTCPLSAQQRAIQWLHAVQIYLPQSGMAMVLVVGVSLGGCQLYVLWQQVSLFSNVWFRFQKLQRTVGRQLLSNSNEKFGIMPFVL